MPVLAQHQNDHIPFSNNNYSEMTDIKLPKVQLPKFSGLYKKNEFRDIFDSLMNTKPLISDILKLV